ncbi:cell differentiation protein rcd1 [Halteromyces radiatus]|uniref:cell differentiation protein rcd1 n=1 Tax=Halteromyces radiatus TaxID=101107 RepID=UPI002220FE84|nr:cell differentiation protein rcd1 [Halteromyces radiatus]KAI8088734.1 cell differentiation protein rcd1 [Halteromyces radiatus]
MHPNSQLHQYLQQSPLSANTSNNPLAAVLQSASAGAGGINSLSQHYSALGSGANQPQNLAAMQQQHPAITRTPVTNGNTDPFATYAALMGNNPAAAAAAAAAANQQQMSNPLNTNFPFMQQDHQQVQGPPQQQQQQQQKIGQLDEEKIYALVLDLLNPVLREQALLDLSKKREQYEDLALVLWYSYGVMSVLLQEIVSAYPLLTPPTLSGGASNRVCNALALLQCVANHNETRTLFLHAHIPLYLYPFLNTSSKTRPFEYLRLTSLGVIGALVKNDNPEVISFLLSTEIIPLCLRIMETGSELSKTVAIFIVQKILLDDTGLYYICQTYERFYAVATVLNNMVNQLVEAQAMRLLKHVIRCYLRLSDNPRAREALRQCLPDPLRDTTFQQALKDDIPTKRCLGQLLLNLSDGMH